ncbi:MAG TPA: hypothetical protein VEW28_01840 [Candidatus Kapabacteria bacterium]|nr:hypothetical protein [Candidatus Kapabacteria bacterium]
MIATVISLGIAGCSKDKTEQPAQQNTPAAAVQTAEDQTKKWESFKFEAEMKIAALEDSLARYDEAMLMLDPKYKAEVAKARAIRHRAAVLRYELAHRDEATGSMQRAGEAISGGIDSLGHDIASIVTSKKK